jgi:hypothetical protein
VAASLGADLTELLVDTQRLLAGAEPNLADWQDYGRRRSELFERLQSDPEAAARSGSEAGALERLCARVLENDRLLMLKIEQHLSAISRDLETLSEQRRLVEAYAGHPRQSFHRVTA